MQRTPTSELIFVVVGGLLCLANAVHFLRQIRFRQLFSQIRSALPKFSAETKYDDELGRIVRSKMEQLKVQQMRKVCQALCVLFSIWTGLTMVNIARRTAIKGSWGLDFITLFLQSVLTAVTLRPSLLSRKSIDLVYGSCIVAATAFVSPWLWSPERLSLMVFMVDNCVVCANMVRRSMSAVLPLNVLYAIVSSSTLLLVANIPAGQLPFFLSAHLLFLSVFPFVARFLDSSMASAIRQTLESQSTGELFKAASAILRSCCDVVVELNSDGIIQCPTEDLGGFLLRDADCHLENTPLADLLPDEDDKKMFRQKLQEKSPEGVGFADAMHVSMRDGNDVKLKVEILSFQYRHLGGQQRYMIGLREFPDVPATSSRKRQQPGSSNDSPEKREVDQDQRDNSDTGNMDEEDEEEQEEETSIGSLRVPDDRADQDLSLASLTVDLTCDGLRVCGCSAVFQMRVGRLAPGACLRDFVQQADAFHSWMRKAVEQWPGWPDRRVTLNLRQGRFTAICRVVKETEGEAIDHKHVHLRFYNVKRCPSHSDGCSGFRRHMNFRGTPVLHMAL